MALAFSAFGITGVGASELFAYPYWCIEKGYARYAGARSRRRRPGRTRARGWTRVMQLDAWFSMVVFTVATVAFYFLGAAVLHPQGLDPKGPEMIPTLSRMYLQPLEGTPLAGLAPVHARRLSAGGLGRPVQDALRRHGRQQPADGRLPPPARRLAAGRPGAARPDGQALLRDLSRRSSLGLYYAFREPQGLIKAGGIAQALMLPFIAGATIYLRRRDTDRRVGPSFLSATSSPGSPSSRSRPSRSTAPSTRSRGLPRSCA